MSSITFVTSFFNIYNIDNSPKYSNFIKLAESGIQICLYTDKRCYNQLLKMNKYSNVKLMQPIQLEDTIIYKICKNIDYSLPNIRNKKKDTEKYIISKHTKLELLNKTICENPWNSTHFAWIDFSCIRIFKNEEEIINQISILSKRTFIEKLFIIPQSMKMLEKNNVENILNNIYWRFISKFFLADSNSITNLFKLHIQYFEDFLQQHKILIWEINFWAWLESNHDWKPNLYLINDYSEIFNIPSIYYAKNLNDKLLKITYDYPKIENFFPSSAAYLNFNGKHYLNTRFVNYSYHENGHYIINDPKNTIITKNIFSLLNRNLIPIINIEMGEQNIKLANYDMYSVGLEDIRLYSHNDKIKYIATNVNYVGNLANRMIVGYYDLISYEYFNSKIIQPPKQTMCEKNWIPLIIDNEEFFIYKWSPFELGKIDYNMNQLEIIKSYEIKSPDFHRFRGSSIFINNIDNLNLIGVVHYCEESRPRQYFHVLVMLDKKTAKPLFYSDPFCFQHYGVEFCIGFAIKNNKYVFWISKKDNDAIMVSIDINEIPIRHNVLISNSN